MKVKDLLNILGEHDCITIFFEGYDHVIYLLEDSFVTNLNKFKYKEKILNWKIEKILADSSTLCICLSQNVSKEDREVAMKIIYSIKIFGEC